MDQAQPQFVPGRSCDGCAMCCKLMGITALDKPPNQWCAHCVGHESCGIYEVRPEECRGFYCTWLIDPTIPEEWAPKQSKIMLSVDDTSVVITVDPSRAGAWRKAPFYETIRHWAKVATPRGKAVLVFEGAQCTAVLPDREKPLGLTQRGQGYVLMRADRPGGPVFDVVVKPPEAT